MKTPRRFFFGSCLMASVLLHTAGYTQSDKKPKSKDKPKATRESSLSTFAETITQDDLRRHLTIIAADSMEGRLTGKPGQKKAAKYIAEQFKHIGLQPPVPTEAGMSYLQPYTMTKESWGDVYIKVGAEKLNFKTDFYVLKNSNLSTETPFTLVFVGKGSEQDLQAAAAKTDLKGKAVLFLETEESEWDKAARARKAGAAAVLMIKGNNEAAFKDALNYNNYSLSRRTNNLRGKITPEQAVFYLSPTVISKVMGVGLADLEGGNIALGTTAPQPLGIKAERVREPQFEAENVLGFLEGTDKKDEVLVITAHYDHVGVNSGQVYNGADDDGSGTVSVLEIAEAFMKAKAAGKSPRRSVLFMTVSGEELGLFGSEFYADVEPIFPLANTVANLNIDMVGRIGGDYIATNDPNYVYIIGSDKLSSELHSLSEETNKTYTQLKLDYKYNSENDPNRFYYRSDHYNFAKNNIPIIFYFNGTHPDYHQPGDDVEKIHFPKMEKIARLVFYTAWEIANREARLKVDKVNDMKGKR